MTVGLALRANPRAPGAHVITLVGAPARVNEGLVVWLPAPGLLLAKCPRGSRRAARAAGMEAATRQAAMMMSRLTA